MEQQLLCIDLDGTVHTRDELMPGARIAIDRLRAAGHQVRFLTNTDSSSNEQLRGPDGQVSRSTQP